MVKSVKTYKSFSLLAWLTTRGTSPNCEYSSFYSFLLIYVYYVVNIYWAHFVCGHMIMNCCLQSWVDLDSPPKLYIYANPDLSKPFYLHNIPANKMHKSSKVKPSTERITRAARSFSMFVLGETISLIRSSKSVRLQTVGWWYCCNICLFPFHLWLSFSIMISAHSCQMKIPKLLLQKE